jgi:CrcB protein
VTPFPSSDPFVGRVVAPVPLSGRIMMGAIRMSVTETSLLVMLGSSLGGGARLWLATAVARPLGTHFPWGTLAVNLLGCLAVGILGALLAPPGRIHDAQSVRVFLIVGTRWFHHLSAFALDALVLVQRGVAGPRHARPPSVLGACSRRAPATPPSRLYCGDRYCWTTS